MKPPSLTLLPVDRIEEDQLIVGYGLDLDPDEALHRQVARMDRHHIPNGSRVRMPDGTLHVGCFRADRLCYVTAGELRRAKLNASQDINRKFLRMLAEHPDDQQLVMWWN